MPDQLALFSQIPAVLDGSPFRPSGKRPERLAGRLDDLDLEHAERVIAAETADATRPGVCPGHGREPQVDRDDDGISRCLQCGRELR
jgi:hypothetical protein